MKVPEPVKDSPKADKGSKTTLWLILAAVGLLGAGVGAGFGSARLLGNSGDEESSTKEEPKEKEGEGAKAAGGHGEGETPAASAEGGAPIDPANAGKRIVSLGDFIVNLRGTSGARVLRMQIQAMGSADAAVACTAQEAPVRDAILTLASDYTYTDLDGLDGKLRLRDELLRRVNAIIKPAKLENLYFTAFVIQ